MNRYWAWIKVHPWQALIFPITVVALVLLWIFHGGEKPLKPALSGTTDQAADEALKIKEEALQIYLRGLEDVTKRAREKLDKATAEQLAEYKLMSGKTPTTIASWIDKLG